MTDSVVEATMAAVSRGHELQYSDFPDMSAFCQAFEANLTLMESLHVGVSERHSCILFLLKVQSALPVWVSQVIGSSKGDQDHKFNLQSLYEQVIDVAHRSSTANPSSNKRSGVINKTQAAEQVDISNSVAAGSVAFASKRPTPRSTDVSKNQQKALPSEASAGKAAPPGPISTARQSFGVSF